MITPFRVWDDLVEIAEDWFEAIFRPYIDIYWSLEFECLIRRLERERTSPPLSRL